MVIIRGGVTIFSKNSVKFIEKPCVKITLASILLFLVIITMNAPVHRLGDAGTYYMQIQSIANDFDIQYELKDINRAFEDDFKPEGLFLIKTDEGKYFYGKEFTYAIFSAPFYKLLGKNGILFFNGLMFFSMILIGYLYLRYHNDDIIATGISSLYFFLSAAFVYIFWIHAEIYNMFLIMTGMFLWEIYFLRKDSKYLFISSFILGIACVAKVPNIVFFIPLLVYEIYCKRYYNSFLMFTIYLVPLITVYSYFFINTGSISFYGGNRLSYLYKYPFLDGYDAINEVGKPFFSINQNNIDTLINTDNIKIIPYNLFYYFFGSFTGILWYYPFILTGIISILTSLYEKKEINKKTHDIKAYINSDENKLPTDKIIILASILLYILFFSIVVGYNYWGGSHAIGNRYFYVYPVFLFLIQKVNLKQFLIVTLLAIITLNPIISDPIGSSANPSSHQMIFPYSYLPIEYTQLKYLPFWERFHKTGNLEIYELDKNSKFLDNQFIINGSTNLLLRSDNKIKAVSFIYGSEDEDVSFSLEFGEEKYNNTLKQEEANYVVFTRIEPVYYDKKNHVYKLTISPTGKMWIIIREIGFENDASNLLFLRNWYHLEDWGGIPTRWISNNATIGAYSQENITASISFRAVGYNQSKNIYIYNNGILEQNISVYPKIFTDAHTTLHLRKGMNLIRFYVAEDCLKPENVENSIDSRCLSVAFQNITIAPLNNC